MNDFQKPDDEPLVIAKPPLRGDSEFSFGVLMLGLFLVMLVYALALMTAKNARAHSFYPWECCHDRDCWPTGVADDAREPDPIFTPAGWRLHDGRVVPFRETRLSPDGRFHVCRQAAKSDGAVIRPANARPCLWAPAQSF